MTTLSDLPEELLLEIFKQVCKPENPLYGPSSHWGWEPECYRVAPLRLVNRRFSYIGRPLLYTHFKAGSFVSLRRIQQFLRLLHQQPDLATFTKSIDLGNSRQSFDESEVMEETEEEVEQNHEIWRTETEEVRHWDILHMPKNNHNISRYSILCTLFLLCKLPRLHTIYVHFNPFFEMLPYFILKGVFNLFPSALTTLQALHWVPPSNSGVNLSSLLHMISLAPKLRHVACSFLCAIPRHTYGKHLQLDGMESAITSLKLVQARIPGTYLAHLFSATKHLTHLKCESAIIYKPIKFSMALQKLHASLESLVLGCRIVDMNLGDDPAQAGPATIGPFNIFPRLRTIRAAYRWQGSQGPTLAEMLPPSIENLTLLCPDEDESLHKFFEEVFGVVKCKRFGGQMQKLVVLDLFGTRTEYKLGREEEIAGLCRQCDILLRDMRLPYLP
ncbi:hypothetical protein BDD12DRAFT_862337 [Trichophaea hybrida]|nr:hypothetical protein BDD12DRAFT_862337 [Trichophaea hybrida]